MNAPEAMNVLAQLPERASAAACFGEPAMSGDRVAIPVAEVMCGLAFGWGGGTDPERHNEGSGGGGGGGARARAVAVIELGPEGVRVHQIVDQTAVSLAGIAFAGAATALLARGLRRWLR